MNTFLKSESGASLLLFALTLVPVLLLTSLSIDVTRQAYVQTKLAYACDAAALAGAKFNTTNFQKNTAEFFDANFDATAQDATIERSFTISNDGDVVTCQASGTINTNLSPLSGIMKLNVSANTTVQRDFAKSEIAVALDSKGGTDNNLAPGLKGALNGFISHISSGNNKNSKIGISLVPYAGTVNIGTNHSSWLTNPSDATNTNLFPSSSPWTGCVRTPYNGLTMATDDSPTTTKWPIFYAASTYNNPLSPSPGDNDYNTANGKVITKISGVNDIGPNRGCAQTILPLTLPTNSLTNYVNAIKPTSSSSAFADLGFLMAWNTISPKWSGLWGGSFDPLPYGQSIKSIVLFSNSLSNWGGITGYNPTTGEPTSYGDDVTRSSAGLLGASSPSFTGTCTNANASNCIVARIKDVCSKIKANKIQIFTITYGNLDPATKSALAGCATNPEWAFTASSNGELKTAFETIGDLLQYVIVTK